MAKFDKDTTVDEVAGEFAGEIRGKIGKTYRLVDREEQILMMIVLITGVSPRGLGAETARSISRYDPEMVILAGRSLERLKCTQENIKKDGSTAATRLLELDLASQVGVRDAAEKVNNYSESIDCLINNAGVMASPFQLSSEGIESQFATNHLGHFLFTNLIMKKLLASKHGGRVINVSSTAHKRQRIRFDDYNFEVFTPSQAADTV